MMLILIILVERMNELEKNLIKMIDGLFKQTDKDHKVVLRLYKKYRDNLDKFVYQMFMRYGNEGKIDFSVLQGNGEVYQLERFLKEQAKDVLTSEVVIMDTILAEVYTATYYNTAYLVEKGIERAISFNLLNTEFVKEAVDFNWSGVSFSERIWNNQNQLIQSLRTEITESIKEGESIEKVARRIRKEFGSSAYQSQRLVRTESSRIIASAQDKIYQNSDVLEQVKYLATLESNTCNLCAADDSKVFNKNDPGKPKIPRHPNCRCVYTPYIEGFGNKTRKDNETGEIISNMSFKEWEKLRNIS
jgi:SPP1 gp7 family putative phage head morphogenesis protein